MTFSRQLQLIASLTALSLGAVVALSTVNLNALRSEFNGYQTTENVYKGLIEIKATALSVAKDDPILAETSERIARADQRVQKLFQRIVTTAPSESAQRLQPLLAQWNAYIKGFRGAIKIAEESPMDALNIPDAMYKLHLQPMVTTLDDEAGRYQEAEDASQSRISELMRDLLWIVLTPMIAAGILINLFQLLFGRALNRRIREVSTVVGRLNKGDFSQRLPTPHDEVGQMAGVINGFVERLEVTLQHIHEAAEQTRQTAHRISGMTDAASENARLQSDRFLQVRTAIGQMGASISETATTANNAAASADGARSLVRQGNDTGQLTIASLDRIDETVTASAHTIAELATAIQRVGNVSKVIEEIAEQTNLLALNAAIEAARAGEQGRGFAVVADEVRHLSKRTASSTSDILAIVRAIQDGTEQASAAMERAKTEVRTGVEHGMRMGEVLNQIDEAVHDVAAMMQQIAAATEEQSSVGGNISENVDDVVGISSATARDVDSTRQAMTRLVDTSQLLHDTLAGFSPAA